MLQGKILVCYAAFVLPRIGLFSGTETCDSLFQNNENESSLAYTDIFLSFLLSFWKTVLRNLHFDDQSKQAVFFFRHGVS